MAVKGDAGVYALALSPEFSWSSLNMWRRMSIENPEGVWLFPFFMLLRFW